jgi:GxxExxY protein
MTERDLPFSARPEPFILFLSLGGGRGFLGDLGGFARDSLGGGVTENEVAKQIVDAAFRVHTSLGPGLLESAYETVLAYELESRGLRVVRQQAVPIVYHGTRIEMGFRADLIVEDLVIVEIKSVEAVAPVHKKQLLTHLRLGDKRVGLLINFNVALIKDGITRIANGMPD